MENPMCLYWKMIMCLQIDILLFLRSIRESNFRLYVLSLRNLRIGIFGMDHYHYSRWLCIHLFDLMHLHFDCPDVYFLDWQILNMTGKFESEKKEKEQKLVYPLEALNKLREAVKWRPE